VPTVIRIDGLRVAIYPNDHRPAHVHVIGPGREAVFILNCPNGPANMRESYGFDGQALRTIAVALDAALKTLCGSWKAIHGHY
jgi:hypothetical protein